jgi:hypothetical protein
VLLPKLFEEAVDFFVELLNLALPVEVEQIHLG